MQVSQVNDHISHVVIGGSQTVEFGISNSAEFFNILSSTLYSDQILAVVREVLCNAWDAHIEAGCTDRPVQVEFTNEAMTIRDFGKGIPPDLIGPIYGTYGNSTKKNDGKQTGGFGLGCKAPFAYTEHFEVQSSHGGTCTVYTLSRSSAQAMGKPGITPIAAFPQDQTGLQVTIPIKSRSDTARFISLVQQIAYGGDMNVTLDGQRIEGIDFPKDQNFLILTNNTNLIYPGESVLVRYGNVIYPVPRHEKINEKFNAIEEILQHARGTYQRNCIIFQAPPHSIAVTPSRETLSMQDHTIHTLMDLFIDFLAQEKKEFAPACVKFAKESVKNAVTQKAFSDLLCEILTLPTAKIHSNNERVKTFEEIAAYYMSHNYPEDWAFRRQDLMERTEQLIQAGHIKKPIALAYIRELKDTDSHHKYRCDATDRWFKQYVTGPAIKQILRDTTGILKMDSLGVYDRESNLLNNAYRHSQKFDLIPINKARLKHPSLGLSYLRQILIITSTKRDFLLRAQHHEVMKEFGDNAGYLVYHTGTKKEVPAVALAAFTKAGYRIIDLTRRYDWDAPVIKKTPVKRTKKVGYALLAEAMRSSSWMDLGSCFRSTAQRIEKPAFYLPVCRRNGIYKEDSKLGYDKLRGVIELYGDKGAVPETVHDTKRLIKEGVPSIDEWLPKQVVAYVQNNQNILDHWPFSKRRLNSYKHRNVESVVELVWGTEQMRQRFGLINNLTPMDKQMFDLWEQVKGVYPHLPEVKALDNSLTDIPFDPVNEQLVNKIISNPLLPILDFYMAKNILASTDNTKSDVLADTIYNFINS